MINNARNTSTYLTNLINTARRAQHAIAQEVATQYDISFTQALDAMGIGGRYAGAISRTGGTRTDIELLETIIPNMETFTTATTSFVVARWKRENSRNQESVPTITITTGNTQKIITGSTVSHKLIYDTDDLLRTSATDILHQHRYTLTTHAEWEEIARARGKMHPNLATVITATIEKEDP